MHIKYFNCISKYPTSFLAIKKFYYNKDIVGFSDHTYGVGYSLYNISRGAKIVEKHFTLNKSMEGNDHIGSMDLKDLRQLRDVGNQLYNVASICGGDM